MQPKLARCLVVLLVCAGVLLAASEPAVAHGGTAVISIVESAEVEPFRVRFVIDVTYSTDQEPAELAVVEASATGPTGAVVPLVFERTSAGRYEASVDVPTPGEWHIDVTTSFPPGRANSVVTVEGSTRSATTPTDVSPPRAEVDVDPSSVAAGQQSGTRTIVAIATGVGAAIALGAGLVVWRRRRRSSTRRVAQAQR